MGAAERHEFLSDATGGPAADPDAARSSLKDFPIDESGTTAIEYAIIASLISIMIVAGATTIGTQVNYFFQQMIAPFL
jgi:pilus assembly protein Flp/PilA